MTTTMPPCGHSNGTHPSGCWYVAVVDAVAAERARIRAVVEGMQNPYRNHGGVGQGNAYGSGWEEARAAVLAIIRGEQP
jgi:hypothetical protein